MLHGLNLNDQGDQGVLSQPRTEQAGHRAMLSQHQDPRDKVQTRNRSGDPWVRIQGAEGTGVRHLVRWQGFSKGQENLERYSRSRPLTGPSAPLTGDIPHSTAWLNWTVID